MPHSHPERSEANRKDPAERSKGNATGSLDFARDDRLREVLIILTSCARA
jgi:hypothetical protein